MRNLTTILLLTASALSAQAGWKELSIGPPQGNRSQWSAFGVHTDGAPLLRVIARAYGIPEHKIVGPQWLASERYAINAEVADRETLRPMLQKQLAEWFHLQAHSEQRVIPVFVLKRVQVAQPAAAPADPKARPALTMPHTTIEMFASTLADTLHQPIFNETNLDGFFDIKLAWEFGNMTSLQNAIRQQLGFELVDDKRTVELLIVDYAEKAQLR
jgi:uncharacterized protein (TIGR03435 family)